MKDTDQVKYLGEIYTVIERSRARLPHPHPREGGRITEFSTLNEVLLDTGAVIFECDFTPDCEYTHKDSQSVIGHQPSHTNERGPMYPVETLKLVLKACKVAARDHGPHRYAQHAANALNESGLKPFKSDSWTSGAVASIYRRYAKLIPVRVPSGAQVARLNERARVTAKTDKLDRKKPRVSRTTTRRAVESDHAAADVKPTGELTLAELAHELRKVAVSLHHIAGELIERSKRTDVNERKARRWDEVQSIMNGKIDK